MLLGENQGGFVSSFTTGARLAKVGVTGLVALLSLALMSPVHAVPTEDGPSQPNAVTEFEVDPDTLKASTNWPREVIGPQQVVVEVEGPMALSGNIRIGNQLSRRFGGKKTGRWEATLTPQPPEQGGGMWHSVRASVTRDRRLWNGSNLDKMPKGKMFCRIFVNGQLIVEHSAPYRWNDIVNLATCEINATRYTR